MIASYLRAHLWAPVVLVVIALGGLLLLAFELLLPWSLVALVTLVAMGLAREPFARWRSLRSKGYFGGRRTGDAWLYEEVADGTVRSFALKRERTEPGHTELFVPDEASWRRAVPSWARERRTEIVRRIAERLGASDLHETGA